MSNQTSIYRHGRFNFEGGCIPDAFTAYRTYGEPQNPCIVFPTCYGGRLDSEYLTGTYRPVLKCNSGQLYLIGEGKVCTARIRVKTLAYCHDLGVGSSKVFYCNICLVLQWRGMLVGCYVTRPAEFV